MSVEPAIVDVQGVTEDWLDRVLCQAGCPVGGKVTGVSAKPCGTGQLGDSYRFFIEYDRAGAGPASLVGKFPSVDPSSREFGRSSGYYRSEILFYQQLAPALSLATPTATYAALAENETDFVLLMEDLAPARQVDQLIGCGADESARVLEQLAALHAGSWRRSDLAGQSWLQGPVGAFTQVTDNFADVIEGFAKIGSGLVSEADVSEAAKLLEFQDAWKRVFSQPQCLWHSDIRADNVLFDCNEGVQPVVLLDWQGVGYGRGTIDVAYWLGTSMPTEDRRQHERNLVQHYHQALCAHGVSDYDAEQCWNDYRLQAIHGLQVGVFGLGAVKRTERGDRMWKCWIERCAAQVRDLQSFEALKSFEAK